MYKRFCSFKKIERKKKKQKKKNKPKINFSISLEREKAKWKLRLLHVCSLKGMMISVRCNINGESQLLLRLRYNCDDI